MVDKLAYWVAVRVFNVLFNIRNAYIILRNEKLGFFFRGEHDSYCDEKFSHQSNICFAGGITDVDRTK